MNSIARSALPLIVSGTLGSAVVIHFNLYSGDLALWRNYQLAIYTYDPANQKWVECLANQLVIKGTPLYRLACIATQTEIFALVQTLDCQGYPPHRNPFVRPQYEEVRYAF